MSVAILKIKFPMTVLTCVGKNITHVRTQLRILILIRVMFMIRLERDTILSLLKLLDRLS